MPIDPDLDAALNMGEFIDALGKYKLAHQAANAARSEWSRNRAKQRARRHLDTMAEIGENIRANNSSTTTEEVSK